MALLLGSLSLMAQVAPVIVSDGFTKGLIGIDIDEQGNIWATEHGTGSDDGQVTIIDAMGNKTLFMTGLPSTFIQATGEVVGSYRTYQRPDNKVFVVVGEGSNERSETLLMVDKSDFTPGTPLTMADVELVIDHGTFVHAQGFELSNPFNIDWDADGNIYTADSGANSIVKWDSATGQLSIVKTMDRSPNPLPFGPPMIDPVPTKVLVQPDGTFLISQLTGFPFIPGAANIYSMDAQGNMSVHASGLTCVTDMSFDPSDDELCVMQFGVFGEVNETLNFILGSAAVIKILPNDERDTIAQGIGGLAPSFTFDASGNVYVVDIVFGQVLRFDQLSSASEAVIAQASAKAYPNPTVGEVTISYELMQATTVALDIYDLSGRHVASYQPGQQVPGTHSIRWDGTDNGGQAAAAGTYVYRLVAGQSLVSGLISKVR